MTPDTNAPKTCQVLAASEFYGPLELPMGFDIWRAVAKVCAAWNLGAKEILIILHLIDSQDKHAKKYVNLKQPRYLPAEDWVQLLCVTNEAYVSRLMKSLEQANVLTTVSFVNKHPVRSFTMGFVADVMHAYAGGRPLKRAKADNKIRTSERTRSEARRARSKASELIPSVNKLSFYLHNCEILNFTTVKLKLVQLYNLQNAKQYNCESCSYREETPGLKLHHPTPEVELGAKAVENPPTDDQFAKVAENFKKRFGTSRLDVEYVAKRFRSWGMLYTGKIFAEAENYKGKIHDHRDLQKLMSMTMRKITDEGMDQIETELAAFGKAIPLRVVKEG